MELISVFWLNAVIEVKLIVHLFCSLFLIEKIATVALSRKTSFLIVSIFAF